MRERVNIRKAAYYSIVLNAVQIVGVVAMLALLLAGNRIGDSVWLPRAVMIALVALVCWGAVVDIHEARAMMRRQEQAEALRQAYDRLEDLNQTLRAQRHDFMNHLQVVYSLIEMREDREALNYIERVHGDLQLVSRVMRTASPAVNALLQAKIADCEQRGIEVTLSVSSRWEKLPVPGWEMCRVLGNLIDNSMDALEGCKNPCLTIVLFEDEKGYRFRVENNGGPIPPAVLARIFTAGFTTKEHGQGMGLHIVRDVMQQHHGDISARSDESRTAFEGFLPREAGQPES